MKLPRLPSRRAARILPIVAALFVTPVFAQDISTPLTVETKYVKASVSIADSLKAYPGLYDNLLAEGRRELGRRRAQAAKDAKFEPTMFEDGRRYEYERSYTQRSVVGRYVSIVRTEYEDGLGAHPNHLIDTILWDSAAKKQISIRPFFKEAVPGGPTLKHLAHLIRVALATEKKARDVTVVDPDTDSQLSAVQADLLKIGAVALAASSEKDKSAGLVFYFAPYMVGSYVEGDYTAFIPWADFKNRLSPVGASLFGGERAADDIKQDER